uniref:Uncharacterized protein n=1 Tax=Amphimedon queenslandica TaxID=400682 RepID=A0A1X7VWA8_AMPQE
MTDSHRLCQEPSEEPRKEEDDLVEEAAVYLADRKCPEGCSANRTRQIRKRAEKFVFSAKWGTVLPDQDEWSTIS